MGEGLANEKTVELLADCVHCGFCLPACPTYQLWGEEMDSPRGRIHLMGQVAEGAPLGPSIVEHFDRCLSCLACVAACPSGVRYDQLIDVARSEVEERVRRPLRERMVRSVIFSVFPYPRRLRVARRLLALAERSGLRAMIQRPAVTRRLPPLLRAMEALAPSVDGPRVEVHSSKAPGERRGRVGMLTGCVQAEFFGEVNAATMRVLLAEGFDVVVAATGQCCGALSGHTGRVREAAKFARRMIEAFDLESLDAIVVNAAGCGSAMKHYGDLLAGDPSLAARAAAFSEHTRDLSEFLAEVGTRAERHPVHRVVVYQDACHLAHAQGIRSAPRELLAAIPGLDVRGLSDSELCCGSAGVYNLLEVAAAEALGARKAESVFGSGASAVISANPGCAMQIRSSARRLGRELPVFHIAEVLDASLRGTGLVLPGVGAD